MSEKKTALPSLRSQDWKTVKAETEKINDLITNTPTDDDTELNDLMYAEISLWKNRSSLEEHEQKDKTWIRN